MATATGARTVRPSKPTRRGVPAPTVNKLRPMGDHVVIRATPRDEMTKSGIVIPDTAKEKPQEGVVLAVGPGRVLDGGRRQHMDLESGDKVLYARYAGTEFKLDGEDLLIINAKDILAVVVSRP